MAAKHRAKISRGTRLAVYIRDNWTCQYCGLVIPPNDTGDYANGRYAPWISTGEGFDSITLELDHVIPLKHGGDDSVGNLRAACTPCNKRKLATTRCAKWDVRITLARQVLDSGPANEETALKAAALLLGYLQSELPRPKSLREAGF